MCQQLCRQSVSEFFKTIGDHRKSIQVIRSVNKSVIDLAAKLSANCTKLLETIENHNILATPWLSLSYFYLLNLGGVYKLSRCVNSEADYAQAETLQNLVNMCASTKHAELKEQIRACSKHAQN